MLAKLALILDNDLLKVLDTLICNRSTLLKGDVFSVLRHSLFIVRSFEFALVNGVVDCTESYYIGASFADRL